MFEDHRKSEEVIKENTDWLNQLEGADGSKWQLTPNYCIHRLRKMLSTRASYGIPGSSGTFWSCTLLHLKQDHTVLGLFYGHPLHPFSRHERLLFLLVSVCWIFFVSVETAGYGRKLSVLMTVIVVVPFKKFVRVILECPCFYTQAYSFKHEIDDDEVEGEEGHDGMACLAARAGHAVSFCLFLGAITLLIMGTDRANKIGTDFLVAWFASQIISVFITEVAIMTVMCAIKMYCYPNEVKKFQNKWRAHFEGKGLPIPISMSEVAAKAKRDYIAIRGVTAFYLHYREYDEWFNLGESETSLRQTGVLEKITTSSRFGENPMHVELERGASRAHSFTEQRRLSQEQRQSQGIDGPFPLSSTSPDQGAPLTDRLPRPTMPSPTPTASFRQSGSMASSKAFPGYSPTAPPPARSRQSPGAKMMRKPPSAPMKPNPDS